MDQQNEYHDRLDAILEKHPQYKLEAYNFVLSGLSYTVKKLPKARHVTGKELCAGLRDYAFDQFGPLARMVLEHLGINETRDFGEIVFILVDAGLMSKTEEDSVRDFDRVYDFDEAFDKKCVIDVDDLDLSIGKDESGKYNDTGDN